MKKYYAGYMEAEIIKAHTSRSGNAIYFTVAGGCTTCNDTIAWFPNSQIIFEEPNEYGNCKVYIPVWLLRAKLVDVMRLRELQTCAYPEPYIVDM